MLCALGTIVIAAAAAARMRDRAAVAVGFAAAALLTSGSTLPDGVWTGGLAAIAVAALLRYEPGEPGTVRTTRTTRTIRTFAFVLGGTLAGSWTALLEVQGLPASVAVAGAGGLVIATMYVSRSRPTFAPEVLVDDGLLGIGVLGLSVAIMPGVLDGWHAATNLSGTAGRAVEPTAIPLWTLALVLMSSSLGALYSLWSRR